MKTARLEAFTDGVVAIAITIMVLELKVPASSDLAGLEGTAAIFAAYVLSFVNIGLYWANHHHLMQAAEHVDGRVLWANLFLLFWLSLVPFVIRWLDEASFAPWPTAAYGFVLGMASIGYMMTQRAIIAVNGDNSTLAQALGDDRKGKLSMLGYVVATPFAFVSRWAAITIYVVIAGAWLIPDRRIEKQLEVEENAADAADASESA